MNLFLVILILFAIRVPLILELQDPPNPFFFLFKVQLCHVKQLRNHAQFILLIINTNTLQSVILFDYEEVCVLIRNFLKF